MSAPAVFVRRADGHAELVSIGLDLWDHAGPIRGDRVLFFDRPLPYAVREPRPEGFASRDGQEWLLVEPDVEETWREAGVDHIRRRLFLLDGEDGRLVGAYYWLEISDGATPGSPEG
ncbi:MAG: hypothetical protein GY913_08925 [Proteobacteria bacterium]|nr:hypothetical protein [Pseudomonadota bacterium]MCP4917033.1 hypothetical protein [Pseudomonadota bacterium]